MQLVREDRPAGDFLKCKHCYSPSLQKDTKKLMYGTVLLIVISQACLTSILDE